MNYQQTLAALEARGPQLVPGSAAEDRAVGRFQQLLGDFKAPDFRHRIAEVYARDAFFDDTLKTVRGAAAIEEYLADSAAAIDKGVVDFQDLVAKSGNYYFRWRMTIRFKKLARGQDTHSIGMTHVRFDADGKVALHQDFWDSAAGLFEHVPALGWVLRRAKKSV